jgi:hypothetical protein
MPPITVPTVPVNSSFPTDASAESVFSNEPSVCVEVSSLTDLLSLPGPAARKHPHKDVIRLCAETAARKCTVYLKRQWAWDRRLPRWSDWRDGVSSTPDPVREYNGLQQMRALGLDVPTPLRLLSDSIPGSPRAALVMSEVPIERSLCDWIREGDVQRLDPFARRDLVAALADLSDRLWSSRVRWRSMKVKHVYPQRQSQGRWRLWLIDCEGVRPRATRRQHRRDRTVFLRSLSAAGADAAFLTAVESALFKRHARPA